MSPVLDDDISKRSSSSPARSTRGAGVVRCHPAVALGRDGIAFLNRMAPTPDE